jgi:hypothetical protein
MLAKIWSNMLVVVLCTWLSLEVVVKGMLGVPLAGSMSLFLLVTALYLFASTALGIFLATLARSTPQFGLLAIPVIIPMLLLSGGSTPLDSMPQWLQWVMQGLAVDTLCQPERRDSVSRCRAERGVAGLAGADGHRPAVLSSLRWHAFAKAWRPEQRSVWLLDDQVVEQQIFDHRLAGLVIHHLLGLLQGFLTQFSLPSMLLIASVVCWVNSATS